MPDAAFVVLAAALAVGVLLGFARTVARRQPGLRLAVPLLVGLGYRLVIMVVTSLLETSDRALRGTDEVLFLRQARGLAAGNVEDWVDGISGSLHSLTMAAQIWVTGEPVLSALRVQQMTIELLGIGFLALAVAVLGGPRAATIFAWLAALEPTNAFFSTILHKESLAVLGAGLCIFGISLIWTERYRWAPAAVFAGLVVAGGARGYAALALLVGVLLTTLHVFLRHRMVERAATGLTVALALVGMSIAVLAAPTVLAGPLASLQRSHDSVPSSNANLELGTVDVTDAPGLAAAIGSRTGSLIAQPFPWQLGNRQQQLGAAGTLVWWSALLTLAFVIAKAHRSRRRLIFPLGYVAIGTTIAYALTLTNAGNGFRHRVHLVLLVLAAIALLVPSRERDHGVSGADKPFSGSAAG